MRKLLVTAFSFLVSTAILAASSSTVDPSLIGGGGAAASAARPVAGATALHIMPEELTPAYLSMSRELFEASLGEVKDLRTSHNVLSRYGEGHPSCFMCYAWGVKEQEALYHRLSKDLELAGIHTIIDIKDNRPGTLIYRFTEKIGEVDAVILAGSRKLMEKHSAEGPVVNLEIPQVVDKFRTKWKDGPIIKVLLDGTFDESFPAVLGSGIVGIDLRMNEETPIKNQRKLFKGIFEVIKALYRLGREDAEVEHIRSTLEEQLSILGADPSAIQAYKAEMEEQERRKKEILRANALDILSRARAEEEARLARMQARLEKP